jgi:nitrous oxidase accessory protein NosD
MGDEVGDDQRGDPIDVFISYGHADLAIAREMRTHLEAGGYRCWLAPDDVTGPTTWADQIVKAIRDCRVLLVLVSSDANGSDHVSKEVDLAVEYGKPQLPVRIEDFTPSGTLRYLLGLAQWVDAFPGPIEPHTDAVIRRLATLVADDLASTGKGPPSRPQAPQEDQGRTRPWARRAVLAITAVVAVAAVVVGAYLLIDDPPKPPDDSTVSNETTVAGSSTTETPTTGPVAGQPTTGTLLIDTDTTLVADHEGKIVISADGITLDCDGHEVIAVSPRNDLGKADPYDAGILADGLEEVTIENCAVRDHWTGISVIDSRNVIVRGNTVIETARTDKFTVRTAIRFTDASECTIEGNFIGDFDADAIELMRTDYSMIRNNEIDSAGLAFVFYSSDHNTIISNETSNRPGGPNTGGGVGFYLMDSHGNALDDNIVRGHFMGFQLGSGSSANSIIGTALFDNEHPISVCDDIVALNQYDEYTAGQIDNLEDVFPGTCSTTAPSTTVPDASTDHPLLAVAVQAVLGDRPDLGGDNPRPIFMINRVGIGEPFEDSDYLLTTQEQEELKAALSNLGPVEFISSNEEVITDEPCSPVRDNGMIIRVRQIELSDSHAVIDVSEYTACLAGGGWRITLELTESGWTVTDFQMTFIS